MNHDVATPQAERIEATRPLAPIVLIDDNPDDIFLIQRRILAARVPHPVITFDTAQAAFDGLRPAQLPRLIFCDVRMPGATGFDFLQWVRARAEFATLKVVMLSTSDLPDDIDLSVRLGADGYLIKFPPPSVLAKMIMGGPAMEFVRLPSRHPFKVPVSVDSVPKIRELQ